MLIILMTNGVQFADEYINNPLILEGAEIESTIFSVAQNMAKATERERSLICTFASGLTSKYDQ